MKVEVVLTEADIAQEFAEAMEARDLPEKFFFWFPRSAAGMGGAGQRIPSSMAVLDETWKEHRRAMPARWRSTSPGACP